MFSSNNTREELLNMITGKLLGDGCITKQVGRKPRFQFIHSINDKNWCFYCYEKLIPFLPLPAPHYKKVQDKRTRKGFTECYQVQSRTDPFITWLEQIWYYNRKKVIPFDFLEQYLNEIALAWWYQDDGHLSIKKQTPKKIILSTDNFTSSENMILIDLISRKFLLNFKRDSQNRLILYDKKQIYYFLMLVQPYIHASMNRKLTTNTCTNLINKRTTIYLPDHFTLTKPTYQINQQLRNLDILMETVFDRKRYIDFYKNLHSMFPKYQKMKGYQVVINEQFFSEIQAIKHQTGLTVSEIVTICFSNHSNIKGL